MGRCLVLSVYCCAAAALVACRALHAVCHAAPLGCCLLLARPDCLSLFVVAACKGADISCWMFIVVQCCSFEISHPAIQQRLTGDTMSAGAPNPGPGGLRGRGRQAAAQVRFPLPVSMPAHHNLHLVVLAMHSDLLCMFLHALQPHWVSLCMHA
jgi:hypothetical protein